MSFKRRCIGCGKLYEVEEGVFACPYCGTKQSASITPEIGDIIIFAANYRRNGEFVKAIAEYKRAINLNPEIGESYFGVFLSEYHISDEKNQVFITVNKNSVFENANLNKAMELSYENREKWREFCEKLEFQRQENIKFLNRLSKNDYHAIILAADNQKDLQRAYGLYDFLKTRINVFYQRFTINGCSEETILRLSSIACENISMAFVFCSEDSCSDDNFSQMYRAFLNAFRPQSLYVICEDELYIPQDMPHNSHIIFPDENVNDNVLTKIRIMGNFSLEERTELRNLGKLSKIQDNPSPEIFYERSNL